MNERKVIISPFLQGVLFGTEALLNENSLNKDSPVDLHAIFYACMIQSGIEKFAISGRPASFSKSKFLLNRISPFPSDSWHKALKSVESSIDPPASKEAVKVKASAALNYFLVDLMVAVKQKSSIVIAHPLPDITGLENHLPPEIYIPVRNLLSTIETNDLKLPLPKNFISSENIKRFQEIISSDLFSQYSLSHQALENRSTPKEKALSHVVAKGQSLLNNNDLLRAKRTAISLIPLSSKIIDVVFGKLPGTLAEFFGQQLSQLLKEDRRIVIYRFDPLVKELLSKHLALLNKDKE